MKATLSNDVEKCLKIVSKIMLQRGNPIIQFYEQKSNHVKTSFDNVANDIEPAKHTKKNPETQSKIPKLKKDVPTINLSRTNDRVTHVMDMLLINIIEKLYSNQELSVCFRSAEQIYF